MLLTWFTNLATSVRRNLLIEELKLEQSTLRGFRKQSTIGIEKKSLMKSIAAVAESVSKGNESTVLEGCCSKKELLQSVVDREIYSEF